MAETKNAPKGTAGKQQVPGAEAASGETTAKDPAARINKMDAVRRTLAKFGWEAKPSDMQPYIKKTFGIDMTTDHISTCKGDLARKARNAGEAVPPAKTSAAAKPQAPAPKAPVAPSAPAQKAQALPARAAGGYGEQGGGDIMLADVLTTKELLDRVGADKLRTLIDGLAK